MGMFLEPLKQLILGHLTKYKVQVYLFGSYALGKARPSSDVDIAILPLEPLPESVLIELKEKIEESHIPYQVDLVDLSTVDEKFKQTILSEAIAWTD